MIKICKNCGKEFEDKKYPNKKYCSNQCYYLARRQHDIVYYKNNYAYILLKKDNVHKKVIFDIEDAKKINQFKWHLHLRKSDMRYDACTNTYFDENKKRKYINMPRFILDYNGKKTIDHINRNTLDNRKCNLKICSVLENNQNKNTNTSGCVGVCWDKERNKWHVMFKNKNLGRFVSFDEAVRVRKQAELEYFNC